MERKKKVVTESKWYGVVRRRFEVARPKKGWYVAKRCGFQQRRRRRGLGGETRDLGLGAQEVTSRPLRCDTHSINGIGLWWGLSTLKSDVPRWGPGGKRTGVLIARVPFSKAVMLHLNF